MKILVAPLNWGLGHASRCIPIIQKYLSERAEVVLGGNGISLLLLQQHFPTLRSINLPEFEICYSSGKQQIGAMLRTLPKLIKSSLADHSTLKKILSSEHFDLVISDNRFGLFSPQTHCVFITHQLMVKMPQGFKCFEFFYWYLQKKIINKYDECWIPDMQGGDNLSGDLSHKYPLPINAKFIGHLSRFEKYKDTVPNSKFRIVAVVSGVEPTRSNFENELIKRYQSHEEKVLIVQGIPSEEIQTVTIGSILTVSHMSNGDLAAYLLGAERIISRSGYSSLMDYKTLGVLHKVELHATPGQTEQEYLKIMNTVFD